jgi:hypothetical protein
MNNIYYMQYAGRTRTGSRKAKLFTTDQGGMQDVTYAVAKLCKLRIDVRCEYLIIRGHGFALEPYLLEHLQDIHKDVTLKTL